jgi:hypothetical protein
VLRDCSERRFAPLYRATTSAIHDLAP